MYCKKCGKSVGENANVCIYCGTDLRYGKNDHPSFGVAMFSFFFPLIGFICHMFLYPFAPKRASSARKGAWIGLLTLPVLLVLGIFVIAIVLS